MLLSIGSVDSFPHNLFTIAIAIVSMSSQRQIILFGLNHGLGGSILQGRREGFENKQRIFPARIVQADVVSIYRQFTTIFERDQIPCSLLMKALRAHQAQSTPIITQQRAVAIMAGKQAVALHLIDYLLRRSAA